MATFSTSLSHFYRRPVWNRWACLVVTMHCTVHIFPVIMQIIYFESRILHILLIAEVQNAGVGLVLHMCCWKNGMVYFPSTLWEPVYEYIIPGFQPKSSSFKSSSFQLPYRRHSSSTDCARDLFKGSNRSASLLVSTWKIFFWLGVADFLWVMSAGNVLVRQHHFK